MTSERTDLIVQWVEKWGGHDLPSLVLGLRMSCNGAADPWDDDFLAELVRYMDERLRVWQEPSDAIDNHVRGMCQQAVLIGRSELASRAADGYRINGPEWEVRG